jgi:hypothetical protein
MASGDTQILQNPGLSGTVTLNGIDYQLSGINEDELLIFQSEIETQLGTVRSNVGLLVRDRVNAILTGLRIAKAKIPGNPTFKGIKANSSELGWSYIRPGHIMRTAAASETCNNVWDFAFTSNATTDAKRNWVGFDATPYASPITVDKNAMMVLLGLVPFSPSPTVQEIQIDHNNTSYNPEVVDYGLYLGDAPEGIGLAPIQTRYLAPTDKFLMKSRNRFTATQQIRLFGITFGLGSYMKTDMYTTVAT